MKSRALITGATGYIGSKLCQRLQAEGWHVDVLVRASGRTLNSALTDSITAYFYDGSTQSVMNAVIVSKPNVVFHLASSVIAEHSSDQVADLINSNVLFSTQLVEASARAGVKYFINTGTYWQHYRSTDYDPVCLYAATKQAFEDILDFYADAFKMSIVTLKLFDTYGPDDPRLKLVNLLVRALETGEPIAMSPGEQMLDLLHIDDVTCAFSVCAQQLLNGISSQPHERYTISSGNPINLRQLVSLLEQISGKSMKVTFGARPYREREVMYPWSARKFPPQWDAKIDIRAGLKTLLALNF